MLYVPIAKIEGTLIEITWKAMGFKKNKEPRDSKGHQLSPRPPTVYYKVTDDRIVFRYIQGKYIGKVNEGTELEDLVIC